VPRSPYPNLWARLVANTSEPQSEQDCWRWTARTDREGYGIINLYVPGLRRNATLKAHLLLYVWLESGARTPDDLFLAYKEQAASGLELDHLCTERWCVFPDHLELVTGQQNSQRRGARRVSPRR
jgi:hypothetical protein